MPKNTEENPRQCWRTPRWLFLGLQDFLGVKFTLDAAADCDNTHCKKYFNIRNDALIRTWNKYTFVNPPFRDMLPWSEQCYEQYTEGKNVLLIGPASVNQQWFHKYPLKYAQIIWPTKRIAFDPDPRLIAELGGTGGKMNSPMHNLGFYWFSGEWPRVNTFNVEYYKKKYEGKK